MSKKFRAVAETSVDARKRISLGKAGVREDTRYLVSVNDEGEILLAPLASVPARELLIWENRPLRESLIRGMEEAAAGETHDLGSFAAYLDADEA